MSLVLLRADSTHVLSAVQVGFLNVHSEPGDPYRTDNVVTQLVDGALVQVVSARARERGHAQPAADANIGNASCDRCGVWCRRVCLLIDL